VFEFSSLQTAKGGKVGDGIDKWVGKNPSWSHIFVMGCNGGEGGVGESYRNICKRMVGGETWWRRVAGKIGRAERGPTGNEIY